MAPIELDVTMMGTEHLSLQAEPEDTVATVKNKLVKLIPFEVENLQILHHDHPLVNEDTTLVASGIAAESAPNTPTKLYAVYKPLEHTELEPRGKGVTLRVTTLRGNTIVVQAGTGNSVAEIREVVANRLGLSTVKLTFHGDVLTDDALTLLDVGIDRDSTLYAMHRL